MENNLPKEKQKFEREELPELPAARDTTPAETIPMRVTAKQSAARNADYWPDRPATPPPTSPTSQPFETKTVATNLPEKRSASELAAKANGSAIG